MNKRNLDKISELCGEDRDMLDFLRSIISHELSGAGQYKKAYKEALRKYSKSRERR